MESLLNLGSIILPFVIFVVYVLALYYLVKLIIYVMRLPKQLEVLERRIKQLEEKENK